MKLSPLVSTVTIAALIPSIGFAQLNRGRESEKSKKESTLEKALEYAFDKVVPGAIKDVFSPSTTVGNDVDSGEAVERRQKEAAQRAAGAKSDPGPSKPSKGGGGKSSARAKPSKSSKAHNSKGDKKSPERERREKLFRDRDTNKDGRLDYGREIPERSPDRGTKLC